MVDGRRAALDALGKMRRSGRRLDGVVREVSFSLDEREKTLCLFLCYTVVQQGGLIDLALGKLLNFRKTQPQILDILRLGTAQIWFADRIPRYAVLNESVALARKTAPHAAGMVNAVLRNLPDTPPQTDDLGIRYSMPRWFYERLSLRMPPEEIEAFFEASNRTPPLYFQKNPLITGLLPQSARSHPDLEGCYLLSDPKTVANLCRDGRGIAADPGARLCVMALGATPGQRLWDACAAPGGKSFMMGFALQNEGEITATDQSFEKLPEMKAAATALGLQNITIVRMDAERECPDGLFDAVLCDVPCSGMGVLRKKPDIRYKKETDIVNLPQKQAAILKNAARAVKPGGVLVYSTCTVLQEENEGVIRSFLKDTSEFSTQAFTLPIAGDCPQGMVTLLPHKHDTDGFFICKMSKHGTRQES